MTPLGELLSCHLELWWIDHWLQ